MINQYQYELNDWYDVPSNEMTLEQARQAVKDLRKKLQEYLGETVNIEKLPSAQPEIIRCKDCKHRDAENGFCEGRGWPMQLVPDDGFCDKGERRTDG